VAPPLLVHLDRDPSEIRYVATIHSELLAQIQDALQAHRSGLVPGTPQL
jgi:hypothetical protein